MAVEISILSGEQQGRTARFDGDRVFIGDGPSADLRFDPEREPAVQNKSAVLRLDDEEGWRIANEGRGTWYVNQTAVGPRGSQRLRSEDVVRLSETGPDFCFRIVTSRKPHSPAESTIAAPPVQAVATVAPATMPDAATPTPNAGAGAIEARSANEAGITTRSASEDGDAAPRSRVAIVSSSPAPRAKRREANPIGRAIGIIVSGLLGLAAAYALSRWIDSRAPAKATLKKDSSGPVEPSGSPVEEPRNSAAGPSKTTPSKPTGTAALPQPASAPRPPPPPPPPPKLSEEEIAARCSPAVVWLGIQVPNRPAPLSFCCGWAASPTEVITTAYNAQTLSKLSQDGGRIIATCANPAITRVPVTKVSCHPRFRADDSETDAAVLANLFYNSAILTLESPLPRSLGAGKSQSPDAGAEVVIVGFFIPQLSLDAKDADSSVPVIRHCAGRVSEPFSCKGADGLPLSVLEVSDSRGLESGVVCDRWGNVVGLLYHAKETRYLIPCDRWSSLLSQRGP